MTQILITGASGLLGRELMNAFSSYSPIGTAYSRSTPPLVRVDLTNSSQIEQMMEHYQPNVVIHSAAERRPDVSEMNHPQTKRLNVEATAMLARCAHQRKCHVIYLSTDYVFDGTSPPYHPHSTPNPLNYYGQSKYQGEVALAKNHPTATTLRVPILYGPTSSLNESAVLQLVHLITAGLPAEVDHWAIRYPTLTSDIAVACRLMVEYGLKNDIFPEGTYHFSGYEAFTKYEMVCLMGEVLGKSTEFFTPCDQPPAQGTPRPHNCHLDTSRLDQLLSPPRTDFRTGVTEVLCQMGLKNIE